MTVLCQTVLMGIASFAALMMYLGGVAAMRERDRLRVENKRQRKESAHLLRVLKIQYDIEIDKLDKINAMEEYFRLKATQYDTFEDFVGKPLGENP